MTEYHQNKPRQVPYLDKHWSTKLLESSVVNMLS